MNPRLYLASTSPYRAELLARLGLEFSTEPPDVDESTVPGEAPVERALRLAQAKAARVAGRHPADWVLGSDQVAVCGGVVLDKPGTARRCEEQLKASSGQHVEFHTAVVLMRESPQHAALHVDLTRVRFRSLSAGEIARYVELDRPFDCAGGFRCEKLGVALFESIESSDPTGLVGLPLIWVARALRAAGLDPLASVQS